MLVSFANFLAPASWKTFCVLVLHFGMSLYLLGPVNRSFVVNGPMVSAKLRSVAIVEDAMSLRSSGIAIVAGLRESADSGKWLVEVVLCWHSWCILTGAVACPTSQLRCCGMVGIAGCPKRFRVASRFWLAKHWKRGLVNMSPDSAVITSLCAASYGNITIICAALMAVVVTSSC